MKYFLKITLFCAVIGGVFASNNMREKSNVISLLDMQSVLASDSESDQSTTTTTTKTINTRKVVAYKDQNGKYHENLPNSAAEGTTYTEIVAKTTWKVENGTNVVTSSSTSFETGNTYTFK